MYIGWQYDYLDVPKHITGCLQVTIGLFGDVN